MIKIEKIVFNDFQVNTYLVYDESEETLIIDPACYGEFEEKKLLEIIEAKSLKPVKIVNTHPHIDHIVGNAFVKETYGIEIIGHKKGISFYENAGTMALMFGFNTKSFPQPDIFVDQGDTISFGNTLLHVIYTPGHVDGSICLYDENRTMIIVGDVLFYNSIGRTDLPTGNHELLISNINEKLMCFDDNIIVYTGHGPNTTIEEERKSNPYL